MGKIIDYFRKKVLLKYRQDYLEKFVENLGKIVEEDDKITVYATQKLVDKNGKNVFYRLMCNGINAHHEKTKNIVEKYKLNKPVYFVFDGIVFEEFTRLSSHFSNVIFKNCTFKNGLQVSYAANVTLENNKYINFNWSDYLGYDDSFLYGHIDELTIINDKFVNNYEIGKNATTRFGINISANIVNIINSTVNAESHGQINIRAKEISLANSAILGPEIYLDSESIKLNNTIIHATNGIMIENKNGDFKGEVKSPSVIYNGIDLSAPNKVVSVNEEDAKIKKIRYELLQKLHYLRDYCEQINENKVDIMKEQLNSQTINRVLDKK